MRPTGTAEELERRRRRALALLNQGHGVRETARLVGASPGALVAWRPAYEKGGRQTLRAGWTLKTQLVRGPLRCPGKVAALARERTFSDVFFDFAAGRVIIAVVGGTWYCQCAPHAIGLLL